MSDPCLLAASLLTVGPVPVPPPPTLPPNLAESLSELLTSSFAEAMQPVVAHKIVPIIETIFPEFSQQQPNLAEAQTSAASEPITSVQTPTTLLTATQQETSSPVFSKLESGTVSPTSGSQLYVQRLAALKAGKLYTRVPSDSFQSSWAKETLKGGVPLQQPTHEQWVHLLEREAKAVAKGQGSNHLGVLLGDSLTLWFPSKGLPSRQLWLNQGISGENTGQILQRLSAFSQTRPDTIYVMAGINDLRQGATDETILNNIRQIARRLRLNHPQSQVILQSILPTRLSVISNERIRNLNQQIAAIAQQEGTGFLNLHSLFADGQGQLGQDLTTDGIHLTSRGYEVWQEALNYAETLLATNQTNRVNN